MKSVGKEYIIVERKTASGITRHRMPTLVWKALNDEFCRACRRTVLRHYFSKTFSEAMIWERTKLKKEKKRRCAD